LHGSKCTNRTDIIGYRRQGLKGAIGVGGGINNDTRIPSVGQPTEDAVTSAASQSDVVFDKALVENVTGKDRRTPGRSSLIRKWLPGWGGNRQKKHAVNGKFSDIPFANQLDKSSFDELYEVDTMSDGMASNLPSDVKQFIGEDAFRFKSEDYGNLELQMDTFSAAVAELEELQEKERLDYLGTIEGTKKSWRGQSSQKSRAVVDTPPIQVDHATLDLIRNRIKTGSRPGDRNDPFKLGLVVEGGGMRGCVSGGALQALADLGLKNAFDAVYGSSAGAINATYFLSEQRDGVNIYHEHIASTEFIDLKRLLSRKDGKPAALNLEFLLDHVIHHVLPLDFDSVLNSPVSLNVVASSLDTLSPVLLNDFEHKDDLVECLRASANVPEVAGGPVHHRGHRLVDAAVFEAIPFRSAIADGCTHVLVLCTRPAPVRKSVLDRALTDALQAAVKRAVMNPEYMTDAWRASVKHLMIDGMSHDDMLLRSLDQDSHKHPWFAGTHVFPIYPSSHASSFSPLCIDVPTLKAGVAEGRRAVLAVARAGLADAVDLQKALELGSMSANIVPTTLKNKWQGKKNGSPGEQHLYSNGNKSKPELA
jgi:predicted patatin/cPLA2 family phospholipase